MTNLELAEKFIDDNKLDFSGSGSDLNGACVILAGYICYLLDESDEDVGEGKDIVNILPIATVARGELMRVFNFAWYENYGAFWRTQQAKDEYVF
jgi:hypothetical protein